MKTKYTGESEEENEFDVDEPEALQNASDDDWTPEVENAHGRRQSTRLRNAPRLRTSVIDLTSSEEDASEDEEGTKKRKSKVKAPGRGRGRPVKRVKVSSTSSPSSPSSEKSGDGVKNGSTSDSEPSSTTTPGGNNTPGKGVKGFLSGSFVVSKADLNNTEEDPPIWKIDGKALLQKYVAFTEDGKTLYKNTSVYSGWTPNNRDNYYPINVTFKQQTRKEHIVEFLRDQVKVDENTNSGGEEK